MKRLHVHLAVDDLDQSIGFYTTLFDTAPTVTKDDYAKWKLDDPAVNFAISARSKTTGIDHLGIQVDELVELADISARLDTAGHQNVTQTDAACCYAVSDKSWTRDPDGVRWETFRTSGEIETFGDDTLERIEQPRDACCGGQSNIRSL